MGNAKTVLGLLVVLALATAQTVRGQATSLATAKFCVSINIGGQVAPGAKELSTSSSMIVNNETATLTATQPVNRGTTIDIGAEYRVYKSFRAGIVVTRVGDSETATTSASIPDPLFFYQPKIVAGSTAGLHRSELTIAPHLAYPMTLTDRLDLVVAAGVSAIRLKQDLVNTFSVPDGTQNVTTLATTESGRGYGPYAAVDVVFKLTSHYGIGGFARYAGGKVTTSSLTGVSVGGVQAGAGIRLHF